jgi:hypothetical protein
MHEFGSIFSEGDSSKAYLMVQEKGCVRIGNPGVFPFCSFSSLAFAIIVLNNSLKKLKN